MLAQMNIKKQEYELILKKYNNPYQGVRRKYRENSNKNGFSSFSYRPKKHCKKVKKLHILQRASGDIRSMQKKNKRISLKTHKNRPKNQRKSNKRKKSS